MSLTRPRLATASLLIFSALAAMGLQALRPAPLAAEASAPHGEGALASDPEVSATTAAREIDAIVARHHREQKIKANPIADDATFARRAYLAIIGRIPTAAESSRFLSSTQSRKREALVDELFAAPGRVSHRYNFWADLLRIKGRSGPISGEPYEHWLKESLAQNKPYDQMVRELLTANGGAHVEGNGATGYFLRDRGMPQDNMANTMRLFAGTRIECAQCHNHPFDSWTQMDFYKLSAFTADLVYRDLTALTDEDSAGIREAAREVRRSGDRALRQAYSRIVGRQVTAGIAHTGSGLVALPKDYQYEDAKPGELVKAEVPFGAQPELEVTIPKRKQRARRRGQNRRRNQQRHPPINSRAAFADWLTSTDNDRFASVIVNRMWKDAMGVALIEPLDDLRDGATPTIPELQSFLQDLIVQLDFDLEAFQKILFKTRAWQREAVGEGWEPGKEFSFAGPLMRRMSAEQTWDSLLTLVDRDIDQKIAPALSPEVKRIYERQQNLRGMSADEIMAVVKGEQMRRADPAKYREQRRRESAAMRKKARPLLRELRQARKAGDEQKQEEIMAKLGEMGHPLARMGRARSARGRSALVRASDLPQPAPAGHFLRRFGQSDREIIQQGDRDPNVPQVLELLNGFVEEQVIQNPLATLREELDDTDGAADRVRHAFLAILGRYPTGQELTMWKSDVAGDSDQGLSDLVWTLVNTHEFRFIR
jgi:Protein of unknown function (DUF1549)/Protein of unknown function (DUF1553)